MHTSIFSTDNNDIKLKQDIIEIVTQELGINQSADTRAVLRPLINQNGSQKCYFYNQNGQIEHSFETPEQHYFAMIDHENGTVWVDTDIPEERFAVSQYIDSIDSLKKAPYWNNATNGLKILGQIGENKAVDMVIFVGTGQVQDTEVMTITRNSVNRFGNLNIVQEVALPGGFQEAQVVESQRLEVLEELFSKDLLDNPVVRDSISKNLSLDQSLEAINSVFSAHNSDHLKPSLEDLAGLQHPNDAIDFIKSYVSKLEETYTGEKTAQIKAGIAVELYKMTPLYQMFVELLPPKQVETFKNETDPRNTEISFMSSSVGTLFLNTNQYDAMATAGLVLSGGDDAESAKMISVLTLLRRNDIFSDHKRFICEALFTYELSTADLTAIKDAVTASYAKSCEERQIEPSASLDI